ncbi:MAG TPA: anti-sigma factor domain-containing protein [Bacillales bacterium]|nr:anti-sigma factor domain-containing protein [Bacillales bacterium]
MNQGIVMEIKSKKAIVLTKEGAFETVILKKGQHVEIGSEIDIPVSKSYFNSNTKWISTIVAAAAVLVLLFTQYPFLQNRNLAVAAYVGVDINPSIEVGVNEKLNVVEVIPINDDGKIIVDQITDDYRNKPLSEFIDDTIELAKADGYLTKNKEVLLTTTTINKDTQVKIEEKVNVIKKEIEQRGVVVTSLKGDENTRKEAKDLGVSTGKYMIYKEAKENLTIEETKELSVTQIYEKLDKGKKQKDNEKKNNQIEKNNKEEKNNNKQEKIDEEIKKEQHADNKQQKFEDKKNNKKTDNANVKADQNKNNESDSSNEPPGKNKVKENGGNNGKVNKNNDKDKDEDEDKDKDSSFSNWKSNNKIKESNDDKSSKNKKDDFEKHDKQGDKKSKSKEKEKDNHDNQKGKNNGNKRGD